MIVAVKRLRFHIFRDRNVSKVVFKELKIWSSLRHPNVLSLLGFVIHDKYPALVSQWMINGTMRKYMETNPGIRVKPMAKGIAEGLRYLHEIGVIHSDLKTENILISNTGAPLLANFGISRLVTSMTANTSTTSFKGSARWIAVELLISNLNDSLSTKPSQHTKATDVWAYGMVVYELLSGAEPFSDLRNDLQVAMAIVNGQKPRVPPSFNLDSEDDNVLWRVCQSCWETSAADRPAMAVICDIFTSCATPSHTPTDLEFVFPPSCGSTVDLDAWRRWSDNQWNSPVVSPYHWSDEGAREGASSIGPLEGTGQGGEGQQVVIAGFCVRCKSLGVRCEYTPNDPSTCRRCFNSRSECKKRFLTPTF